MKLFCIRHMILFNIEGTRFADGGERVRVPATIHLPLSLDFILQQDYITCADCRFSREIIFYYHLYRSGLT